MSSSPQHPSVISAVVRAEMLRLGSDRKALAKALGLTEETVSNLVCGNHSSSRARRKLEAYLKIPIWTSEEDFARLLPEIEFFGVPIEALTQKELRVKIKSVAPGEKTNSHTPRRELLQILRDHHAIAIRGATPDTEATPPPNALKKLCVKQTHLH